MIGEIRRKVREKNALIHCITNPISIRECANVILAAGARPMMAEHPLEVETVTKSAGALLLNLGNLTDVRKESMQIAARTAKESGVPFVLDLCGAASLKNRRDLALAIMEIAMPTVIKGNYSEIKALFDETYHCGGVDADLSLTEGEIDRIAMKLAKRHAATILASGRIDVISDGELCYHCMNGTPQLATITGTGCMQGALCAAFLSAGDHAPVKKGESGSCQERGEGGSCPERGEGGSEKEDTCRVPADAGIGIRAALAASCTFGICGQLAETPLGSGTFEVRLLDELSTISDETIEKYVNAERLGIRP